MTYPTVPPTGALPPLVDRALFASLTQGRIPAGVDVDAVLAAASQEIRRRAGWHIAPVIDETMTLDGPGGSILHLPTLRLIDVLSVSQRHRGNTAAQDIDPDELEWSRAGMVRARCPWSSRFGGITVVARHGLDFDAVSAVTTKIAARVAMAPTGAVRETAGPLSVEYGDAAAGVTLLLAERDSLAPYTLPGLP